MNKSSRVEYLGTTRILTVRQPFAEFIVDGIKDVENRSRPTSYRGPVAIHASKSAIWHDDFELAQRLGYNRFEGGIILGVADLFDCVHSQSDSGQCIRSEAINGLALPAASNRYYWVFRSPRKLLTPIVAKGGLGLTTIPTAYLVAINRAAFRRPKPNRASRAERG